MSSYYVASAGSDAANGTSTGTPWQTLAKVAAFTFADGDTLYFNKGDTWTGAGGTSTMLNIPVDNFTIDAYGTGADPIFDLNGGKHGILSGSPRTGSLTQHLKLYNGGNSTGDLWGTSNGTHTIQDCVLDLHSNDTLVSASDATIFVTRCTLSRAGDEAITLHGTTTTTATIANCTISGCVTGLNNSGVGTFNMTVSDCIFSGNGTTSGHEDIDYLANGACTFNRCQFRGGAQTDFAFFKANTGTGTKTFNYCSFDAYASASASNPAFGVDGTVVMNNCTFSGNAGTNGSITVAATGTLTMTNCIVAGFYRVLKGSGTLNADHCIHYGIGAGTWDPTADTNALTTNPLLASPSTAVFTLLAGSSAIDAGTNLSLPLDLAGAAVSNPPEIGCYEYITGRSYRLRMPGRRS